MREFGWDWVIKHWNMCILLHKMGKFDSSSSKFHFWGPILSYLKTLKSSLKHFFALTRPKGTQKIKNAKIVIAPPVPIYKDWMHNFYKIFFFGFDLLPKMKISASDVITTSNGRGGGAYVLRETLRSLRSLRLD